MIDSFLPVCADILRLNKTVLNRSEIDAKRSRCVQYDRVYECCLHRSFGQEYRIIKLSYSDVFHIVISRIKTIFNALVEILQKKCLK